MTNRTTANRDSILISHATGWDDDFTRWLTLQLTNLGYKVWCDIVNLYGGDWTWERIQNVLDCEAIKVVYCFSGEAESRDGCKRELEYANTVARREKGSLERFIIPIRYDNTDFKYMNIHVTGKHAPDFSKRWSDGLDNLLKVLRKDKVPCNESTGPAVSASWWKTSFEYSTKKSLIPRREVYDLNWHPILNMPDRLYWMRIINVLINLPELEELRAFPNQEFANGIFFLFDPKPHLPENSIEVRDIEIPTDRSKPRFVIDGQETEIPVKTVLANLLRQAWERTAENKGLLKHELSRGAIAYYFAKPVDSDALSVQIGKSSRDKRFIVGTAFKTRHWHFAVQMKPMLRYASALAVKYHVLFSDDGKTIWSKKTQLHKARRSFCRMWYNDKWRTLMQAFLLNLSTNKASIDLIIGPIHQLEVSLQPLSVDSSLTYDYSGETPLIEEDEKTSFIEMVDQIEDEERYEISED